MNHRQLQLKEQRRSAAMRAAVMRGYGPPTVLEEAQVERPTLAPDQLLVRVEATSVNPADCKQRAGNLVHIISHKFPCVLGQDFAGTVVEVGPKCRGFSVGDRVYGSTAPRNGCSAEYAAVLRALPFFSKQFKAIQRISTDFNGFQRISTYVNACQSMSRRVNAFEHRRALIEVGDG